MDKNNTRYRCDMLYDVYWVKLLGPFIYPSFNQISMFYSYNDATGVMEQSTLPFSCPFIHGINALVIYYSFNMTKK